MLCHFFFLRLRRPPRSTLFPSTTLFRSDRFFSSFFFFFSFVRGRDWRPTAHLTARLRDCETGPPAKLNVGGGLRSVFQDFVKAWTEAWANGQKNTTRVGRRVRSGVCSALPRNAGEGRISRTGELKLPFRVLKPFAFEFWVFVGLRKSRKLEAWTCDKKEGQNGEARVRIGVGRESWRGLEAWTTERKIFLAFFEKPGIFLSQLLISKREAHRP